VVFRLSSANRMSGAYMSIYVYGFYGTEGQASVCRGYLLNAVEVALDQSPTRSGSACVFICVTGSQDYLIHRIRW
jgi:hypothetical protein